MGDGTGRGAEVGGGGGVGVRGVQNYTPDTHSYINNMYDRIQIFN